LDEAGARLKPSPGDASLIGETFNVRDPVCDMEVDAASAAGSSSYEDDTYYFCSLDCKERFDRDPERYVSRTERSQT
jgi:P-type Cu+ transporter